MFHTFVALVEDKSGVCLEEDGVYLMIAPGVALHKMVRRPLLEIAEDE